MGQFASIAGVGLIHPGMSQERSAPNPPAFDSRPMSDNVGESRLHHCHGFLQQRNWNVPDGDVAHAVVVLECGNDVIHSIICL